MWILSFKNWKVNTPPSKNIHVLALLSLYIFRGRCVYFSNLNDKIHNYVKKMWILTFKNWKLNTPPSKNIQTEQSWYIFLSFWGNEKSKKLNISHHTRTWRSLLFYLVLRWSQRTICYTSYQSWTNDKSRIGSWT